jgi:uncharacterized protein YjbI with pentapeptide repeats
MGDPFGRPVPSPVKSRRRTAQAGRRGNRERRQVAAERIAAARVKTGDFITRLMLTYVGFAAFCVFALQSADRLMIIGQASVNLPVAGEVSFDTFILVAPAVLIGMRIYLEVYFDHWRQLDGQLNQENEPLILSPFKHPLLKRFSTFVLWFLLPGVLTLFTWKVAVRAYWGDGFLVLTALCLVAQLWRLNHWRPNVRTASAFVIFAFLTVTIALGGLPRRSLNLVREDLANAYLFGKDLSYANLNDAKLIGANLTDTNLSYAQLGDVDLTDIKIEGANFTGTNLEGANFTGVRMEKGQFRGANLKRAGFGGATIDKANFEYANLEGVDFSEATLPGASFVGANLNNANLTGATLSFADFTGADLTYARLIDSHLEEAKFFETDLTAVEFSETTTGSPDVRTACGSAESPPYDFPEDAKIPKEWYPCTNLPR